jgi:stress response protein YsnF
MDRISALRNVEEALQAFEAGEADLATTEERVRGVLRTYATDFEDADSAVYRAHTADGDTTVVVAASEPAAADLAADLTGTNPVEVERLG